MTALLEPDTILAYDDDPGAPPQLYPPVQRPRPDLGVTPLAVGIAGPVPDGDAQDPSTAAFRYWAAADALSRAASFWRSVLAADASWNASVGTVLDATVDAGDALNAYYNRAGLSFFHHLSPDGTTYYSALSPDVVCHETGHAVLDAIRPQLWDAASAEVAAFHESFGDISALLSALQLESIRDVVLGQTRGYLSRSSRLSRLAEQLGYAIRLVAPQAVDPDCLRNAANRFFYQDPLTLPSSAPSNTLSSEVHSFSRVFTGAYLRVISGIFRQTGTDSDALLETSVIVARLLVAAAVSAPVTTGYYAQVAAHVIAADQQLFDGKHRRAINAAFQRHGIMSQTSAGALNEITSTQRLTVGIAAAGPQDILPEVQLNGAFFGLSGTLAVTIPGDPPRFAVAGAAITGGSIQPREASVAARGFVEDLIHNGRLSLEEDGDDGPDSSRLTHRIQQMDSGNRRLVRRLFD